MGCPGGCINGGGQPRCTEENYREKRARALYSEDERKVLRKSHENPDLMKDVYKRQVGICWDTGHGALSGQDQGEAIRKIGKRLKAMHVNDNHALQMCIRDSILAESQDIDILISDHDLDREIQEDLEQKGVEVY